MARMIRIQSTSVAAIGYDSERHELRVQFVGGDTYVYAMVPPSLHRELLEAESVGQFVNERVKPIYPFRSAD